ncbi:MAG TPA: hypothetical protein PLO37_22280 [Candidatus Hydrogenedentes bacterium]|nr:hypothetical protein [Candidatus Hydrogenedentota bacterium]HPG69584.1 hypothetical protein [Candidatus Hydrogenedentota bacterium]
MRYLKAALPNGLLVLASLAFVVLAVLVADRLLGRFLPPPPIPSDGLVFWPHAERNFDTLTFKYKEVANGIGLRDHEVTLGRSERYRILALGDSFTYGWGVELEQTWVKLLEKELGARGHDVEIVNAGAPGASPSRYVEIASVAIPNLKPDLVLVAVLQGEDFMQCDELITESPLERFLPGLLRLRDYGSSLWYDGFGTDPAPESEPLTAEQHGAWWAEVAVEVYENMTPEARERFEGLEDGVKKAFFSGDLNPWTLGGSVGVPDFFLRAANMDYPGFQKSFDEMTISVRRLGRLARMYGAKILVVSVPHGAYCNAEANRNLRRLGYDTPPELLDSEVPDRTIQLVCHRAGVPFRSVEHAVREHRDTPGLYFALDPHFSAEGNKLYAGLLRPLIEEIMAR